MSGRACKICEQLKPAVEFYARKDGSSSHQCKTCQRVAAKKRQRALKRTPEGIARYKTAKAKFRASEKGKASRLAEQRSRRARLAPQLNVANARRNKKRRLSLPKSKSYISQLKKTIRNRLEKNRIHGPVAAFNDYLKNVASDEWLDNYYNNVIRKPWVDIRLETHAEKVRVRRLNDPEFAIAERRRSHLKRGIRGGRFSSIIRDAIKRDGASETIERECGYTIAELVKHMESLFTDGMTWEVFCTGRIHIDHIRPVSSFDLSNDDEFKECWGIENLQPLWAEDNLSKRAKPMEQWLADTGGFMMGSGSNSPQIVMAL